MPFIEELISLLFCYFCYFFVCCVLLFYFSDLFSSQMWIQFDASMPAHLRCSADQVKRTVLAAKADGTIRTYLELLIDESDGFPKTAYVTFPQIHFMWPFIFNVLCSKRSPLPQCLRLFIALIGPIPWRVCLKCLNTP